ncbi:MAG: hypothetical protein HY705_07440 [Gemmatimonadetes bacterium]|nr:hypothetical protein [Gemmatimonadota bacterium]
MTRRKTHRRFLGALGLLGLATLPIQGCDPNSILQVTDPDIILDATSASGALALKNGVILRMAQATNGIQGPDALFIYSGLLADEWRSGDTFVQRNDMDQRRFDPTNTFLAGSFRALNRVRVEGGAAITALRTYSPTPAANIGQMFAFIAFAENLAGELYCNGVPLSNLAGRTLEFGDPLSVDSVFTRAVSFSDSALANVTGEVASRITNLAAVVKGRALLNRGQFAAAATAVTSVPTTFRFDVTHSLTVNDNQNWALNPNAKRYTMADLEGGNGLPFSTANDPRVVRKIGGSIFDSAFPITLISQGIWGRTTSIAIATGIEARLIEAEAALQAGGVSGWLSIINTLRTNTALYPTPQTGFTAGAALTAVADPGTAAGRVDLMFRERAFWMFGTGHRLGDLRRLIRQYGRDSEAVFPTGAFFKGGNYEDAVTLPVPFDERNNPQFVECTNRSA